MWTQIETNWTSMIGRMRSNVGELVNPLNDISVESNRPAEVAEASQTAEPDTSLVPAPALD